MSRRVGREFLGAFKMGHTKNVREYIDDELSESLLGQINQGSKEARAALEFLTKFNNEYHKAVVKADDPDALHNTKDLRRDCYRRKNAANRDVSAIHGPRMGRFLDVTGMAVNLLSDTYFDMGARENIEDSIIAILDFVRAKKLTLNE